jgi:hypothetical protein
MQKAPISGRPSTYKFLNWYEHNSSYIQVNVFIFSYCAFAFFAHEPNAFT